MAAEKILFVGHDANRAGAQLVLLQWLKARAAQGQWNYLLLEKGGPLLAQYKKYATVWVWRKEPSNAKKILKNIPFFKREEGGSDEPSKAEKAQWLRTWKQERFQLLVGNTVASLELMQKVQLLRIPQYCYVHELNYSLGMYATEHDMRYLANKVSQVMVVSQRVKEVLEEKYGVPKENIHLLHPSIDLAKPKAGAGKQVREQYQIPADAPLVLGCGLAEWRKGTDVFLRVAKSVMRRHASVHFVWVGMTDNLYSEEMRLERLAWDEEQRVHLLPVAADTKPYFDAMDLLFLSSREDPYPLVMLEAGLAGKPVIGFENSGGISDFTQGIPDLLAPYLEEDLAADLILKWLSKSSAQKQACGQALQSRALAYGPNEFMTAFENIILNQS